MLCDNADIRKILAAARVRLGNWPTPLMDCPGMSHLMIKRDDLSGFGRGGIKIRKLETFIAHYLEKGIRSFVMVVPNVSNLRADMEKLATESGLHVEFVVANDPRLNNRQFKDLPHIRYTPAGASMINVAFHLIAKYFRTLLSREGRVALVLPGASHPSSVIGASLGLLELYDQCKETGRPMPRHIFISASGGSSAAGLILSALILQQQGLRDITIHVVRVYPIPLKAWILFLLYWTKRKYGLNVRIRSGSFRIWRSGMAYGDSDQALENCCRELNDRFGWEVDHVYGARTWTAMQKFLQTEYDGGGLLFWHCGFTPDASVFRRDEQARQIVAFS